MTTEAHVAPAGTLLHPITSITDRIETTRIFSREQPLEVELGAGDGSFLVQWAKLNPAHNFIGVERLLGRVRKIDRKGRRAGLSNLRAIRIEAAYFLEYLLPHHSTLALHVYFPDPWPKRKHRPRRLVNEHFTELARRALTPGGVVHLRTDDRDYFEQMNRVFDANPSFARIHTPADLLAVTTDFERDFHARGFPTLAVSYRLDIGGA